MANYTLSPAPLAAFYDVDGITPLANGRVFTYTAGTTSPATTYRTSSGTPNLNPIQLDGAGTASIYLAAGSYFYVWYRAPTLPGDDTSGGLVGSQDNITATISSGGDIDMQELAGETILAGQAVYLSDGSGGKNAGQLYLTSTANPYSSTRPLVGMCPETIASGSIGTFRISGQITGLTLINGADYYVGTSGALTTAPGRWVGRADSTSSIIISPNPANCPVVVALTDGATPALDASLGNIFTLVTTTNPTIAVPTNPTSGQKIIIRVTASGGARTLSLNTGAGGFRFGSDIGTITQTASGKVDYIGAIYNSVAAFWDVVAFVKGF